MAVALTLSGGAVDENMGYVDRSDNDGDVAPYAVTLRGKAPAVKREREREMDNTKSV
jgi:hypothetical protein